MDLYKPIRNFGYLFIFLGCMGFWVLFAKLQDVDNVIVVWILVGTISMLHLIIGTSVVLKKRWGFSIFKGYLRLMYLGFPLGTLLANRTMQYIKKNNIERYLEP